MNIKLQVARAQLGTALHLFIRDKDAYSVQALACGGSEIIEGLAEQSKRPTLSTHILDTIPDIQRREIKKLRNQYWNAIKHFTGRDNKRVRDDNDLMTRFDDTKNDAVLYGGWVDYHSLLGRLPIEAQIFKVWWYATNEHRMNPDADPAQWRAIFPGISIANRQEQKRRLRRAVEKYRKDQTLLADPETEPCPLCFSALALMNDQ